MRYVAGLDGLRAFAVIAVVLFHGQAPGASGGFLGVSLFFTLSGFLIATLLIAEHDQRGSVALGRFYSRRARRLLPAAYACLLGVVVCATWWSAAQLRHLRGDLLASVLNIANWRFAFATTSYQDLFTSAPSPVAHFWSLAIEEQIYLVLPVVVFVGLRFGRRSLCWITVGLLLASIASTLITSDRDLIYNGTHTRAAELLVGVLLAQLLANRPVVTGNHGRLDWLPGALALSVFSGLVVAASTDQSWIYEGGLPAVALVSAVLIWAIIDGRFPAGLLALGPMVAIGKVSYGIYLFHWPIFLLLDPVRTGLDGVALFVLRCVVTGVVTVAAYRLIEQPIRRGRVLPGRSVAPVMASAAIVVAVAAIVVVPSPRLTEAEQVLALGDATVVDFGARSTATPTGSTMRVDAPSVEAPSGGGEATPDTPATTVPARRSQVLVVGSERAASDALRANDDFDVIDATRTECPLSRASTDHCQALDEQLASLIVSPPDVVVIATGMAESHEALEQRVNAVTDEQIGAFGRREEAAIAATLSAIDTAAATGATVVWYTAAHPISAYFREFQRIGVMRPDMTVVHAPTFELVDTVAESVAQQEDAGADESLRVIVIGDSTSLYLAQALHDGSDDRLTVLWAGANGCPIGPAVSTRDNADGSWIGLKCEPYEEKLPPLVADFRPDAVVVMTGPTELTDQRYADGAEGHAGDEVFAAQRDAAFQRVLGAVGPQMPVLVADLPTLRPGRFTKGEMTSPDRLAAVNAQVAAWAAQYPQVGLFAYRDTLEAAEAEDGSLRADGMHADPEPLEELARQVYVDRLIDQFQDLSGILRP